MLKQDPDLSWLRRDPHGTHGAVCVYAPSGSFQFKPQCAISAGPPVAPVVP